MDKVICLKTVMFFSCLLIMIGGLCFVAVSIWIIIDPETILDLRPNYLLIGGACAAMFVGLSLSYLGYMGCCGAAIENPKALILFFALVLLIFILEFAIAIALYFFGKTLQDEYLLENLQENYSGDDGTDSYSSALNHFMIKFQCCGISGPDDFKEALSFQTNQPSDSVPVACCTRESPKESAQILDVNYCEQKMTGYINEKSCSSAINRLFEKYIYALTACSFAVIVAEVFAMYTAWYLHEEFK